MAVNMSLNLEALIDAVSPNPSQQKFMAMMAVKLKADGWVFKHGVVSLMASKDGQSLSKNMPNLVGHALAGKLSDPVKVVFANSLQAFLSECCTHKPPLEVEDGVGEEAAPMPTVLLDPSSTTQPPQDPMPIAPTPLKAAAPMPSSPVALKDATHIGQLVFGTSPGSLYKVSALHSDLKIAHRLKGDALSIRAEGPLVFDTKQGVPAKLTAMGFSTTPPTHASLHCYITPHLPAARVLGAVIMSLGVAFTSTASPVGLDNAT